MNTVSVTKWVHFVSPEIGDGFFLWVLHEVGEYVFSDLFDNLH